MKKLYNQVNNKVNTMVLKEKIREIMLNKKGEGFVDSALFS